MRNDEAVVYIVDDESIVRRSFERLFKLAGFSVAAFASAEDFLSGCPADACGCLLLDVQMPGLTGLDLQQELSDHNVFLPIVFITGKGDIPMTVKAMKAGAADFLSKPCDESELLEAARVAIARDARDRQQRMEQTDAHRRIQSLTEREREILAMVAGGLLNKQIARRLQIKEGTVKAHRSHIMEKLEVESVAELAILADHSGIELISHS
jgi:FixJ family two-component response regulator